jgi:hypothetical protein
LDAEKGYTWIQHEQTTTKKKREQVQ